MANKEMLDEIRERIKNIIEPSVKTASEGSDYPYLIEMVTKVIEYYVDLILSLQTQDCRIAVVRKEGELPENPYSENWAKAVKILQDSPINSQERKVAHIDKANYGGDMDIYTKTQEDMLSAGYVQEVKDD